MPLLWIDCTADLTRGVTALMDSTPSGMPGTRTFVIIFAGLPLKMFGKNPIVKVILEDRCHT